MPITEPILTISADAITANWCALNAASGGVAGAVVKANAYGFGIKTIAPVLWKAGARDFFVATTAEAIQLAQILPLENHGARIFEFSGLSSQATDLPTSIITTVNTIQQYQYIKLNTSRKYALQFDVGMTRLGIDPRDIPSDATPELIMSHLAYGDEPNAPQNREHLKNFRKITTQFPYTPASLAATGGILAGPDFHFDSTRPGIGIYGGAPFMNATPTVQISLPTIGIREIATGTKIGYSGTFTAAKPMRVATLLGGYADGIMRALQPANLFAGNTPCPILGRISMDAITIDVTHLRDVPATFDLIHKTQSINDLADMADTIAYELFTGLGSRYKRVIK